ncbi:DUF1611 domain-containing protein [Arthrobacter sp. NPDC058097]|uniref:DUF1611 domain-containing protein n=1 Tax=Arthrobacter sp. NPDC058097 TaxID=3346340 RepID=UPI0036DE261D
MSTTLSSYDLAERPAFRSTPEHAEPLAPLRLVRAKKAYTTRFLADRLSRSPQGFFLHSGTGVAPAPGDVVLARIAGVGQHPRLESPASRRQLLFLGDEILVAYGHRYAPDQFLAEVPADLGHCHLIAAGGVAGLVTARHALMSQPTQLAPVGLLADVHGLLNLSQLAPHRVGATGPGAVDSRGPLVIAVLGTSMNSGKSTALSCLVRGLTEAGLAVAAGKATGTGSGNDPGMFVDAGAVKVLDFTDFGYPTTFQLDRGRVRGLFSDLVGALSASAPDVVVVEIADGVYQGETRALLADPVFQTGVDRVIFAAADALGAIAGLQVLHGANIDVAAVTGVLTSSPLAAREAAAATDVPVLNTASLCESGVAVDLLPRTAREPAAASS